MQQSGRLVAAVLALLAVPGACDELRAPFGALGALRDDARARGLDLQFVYTGEQAWVRGGNETGTTYLDNADLTLAADLDALLGLRGGDAFVYVLGNSGGSPSELAGDWQVVSNIDAPDTWKVYELWYQQRWGDERYSLKAGLYDLNSEFDAIATATLFLNSAFGIGSDISQSGVNGPSIFPTTSLALRGRAAFGGRFYAQAVVLDGVPGDPDFSRGTQIELDRDDGLLLVGETGYLHEPAGVGDGRYRKLAVGGWRYTAAVDEDAYGNPVRARENSGIYALAEGSLLPERNDPAQGLAGFLRYGLADQHINRLDAFLSGGLVYTGMFPGRDADRLGVGVAYARNSQRFRDAAAADGAPVDSHETVVELSYRAELLAWLALQLDYQYVVNPGMDPQLDDAPVWLLRFEISL